MPTDYSLADLVKLTGVSPRTVRYYIAQGLLPSPSQAGPAARYSEAHLDRLRMIKRLQAAHLPLAEIRTRLRALPDDQLAAAAAAEDGTRVAEPQDSALDYISKVLHADQPVFALPVQARAAMPSAPMPSAPPPPVMASGPAPAATTQPSNEPDRAQWDRITLDPDVELHVRRPLTRQHNKRVERLISIARQLLEED